MDRLGLGKYSEPAIFDSSGGFLLQAYSSVHKGVTAERSCKLCRFSSKKSALNVGDTALAWHPHPASKPSVSEHVSIGAAPVFLP